MTPLPSREDVERVANALPDKRCAYAAPDEGISPCATAPIASIDHWCAPCVYAVAARLLRATLEWDEHGLPGWWPLPTDDMPTDREWTKVEWLRNQWHMSNECEEAALADLAALRAQLAPAPAELARLRGIIERDRTAAGQLAQAILKELHRRRWLLTSRGSYEWDDDRYRKEAGWAFDAITKLVEQFTEAAHVRDRSDCPTTQVEIDAARAGLVVAGEAAPPGAREALESIEAFLRVSGHYITAARINEREAALRGLAVLRAALSRSLAGGEG